MRALLLAAGLVLLAAAPAGAATVTFSPAVYYADDDARPVCPSKVPECGPPPNLFARMTVTDKGAANDDLVLEIGAKHEDGYPAEITVRDAAGLVLEGAPATCSQIDATTVRCTSNHPKLGISTTAVLGAGDDRARGAGYGEFDGGPGNDDLEGSRLVGGPGNDTLVGYNVKGDGGDDTVMAGPLYGATLEGGTGRDTVIGSSQADQIYSSGGPAGSGDTIDGGQGTDEISYEAANRAVLVDLAGASPTTDAVSNVENIVGSGRRGDVLRGDDRSNSIAPGYGDGPTLIDGRGGGDYLFSDYAGGTFIGGAGNDEIDVLEAAFATVSGGAGQDFLRVRASALTSCGTGADRVTDYSAGALRPILLAAADCEAFGQTPKIARHRLRLDVRVPCPPAVTGLRRCGVFVEALTVLGTPLGREDRTLAPGTSQVVRVALARRVRVVVLRIVRTDVLSGDARQVDDRTVRVRL